jgi:hypothetical protein
MSLSWKEFCKTISWLDVGRNVRKMNVLSLCLLSQLVMMYMVSERGLEK